VVKKILYGFLGMLFGIIRSAVVGVLIAIAIGGPSPDGIEMALYASSYLLPAILLYHFCYAFKAKYYVSDILYFIWFNSIIAFFTYGGSIPDGDGGDYYCRAFLCFSFFSGIAIYLAEVAFRNKKRLKESGYKDEVKGTNWEDIFGQIFKQPETIFLYSIRSYVIAVVVIALASAGEYFIDLHIRDLQFVVYGLIFSLFLLPGIILYHSAISLRLKRYICDIIYSATVVIIQILILLFAWRGDTIKNTINYITQLDGFFLLIFGVLIILLGGIFVYMMEVYFRNRAVFNEISGKKETLIQKFYSCIKASAVIIGIIAIVIGITFGVAKHAEFKKHEEMKAYARKFIGSILNDTNFYKQCIEDSLVSVDYVNGFIPMMTPNYKVTYGSYYGIGAEYNCRVEFDNGTVLWLEVVNYRGEFKIWRIVEERTKEEQTKILKNMIDSLKVMRAVEANEPVDINNAPSEMREYIKERKIEKALGN